MYEATTLLLTAVLVGATTGVVAYRRGQRSAAAWLVRPHTERTLARMPLPEDTERETFSVSQGVFTRTRLQ